MASHPATRPLSRLAAVLGAAILLAGLAACTPSEPEPTPTETKAVPIFETDEEALAAAEEALDACYDAVGAAGEAGGEGAEAIRTVSVDPVASAQIESLEALGEQGLRIDGRTTYYDLRFTEQWQESESAHVSTYFCVDSSTTRVLDESGADVTDPDRLPIAPVSGEFVSAKAGSADLMLKEVRSWDGDNFC